MIWRMAMQVYHYLQKLRRKARMKLTFVILSLILLTEKNHAADLQFSSQRREVPYEMPEEGSDFLSRFSIMSRDRFEHRSFDFANPFRMRMYDLSLIDPNDPIISAGQIGGSMKFALREIAVDTAFVQDSEEWFKNLFEGTIGNLDEEEVTIAGSPHLQYSEESWRRGMKKGPIKWGVRLLRWPDPYVYVSGRMGHYDGQEILVWHLRYYLEKFKGQRVEALLSMPLPEDFFLSVGMVYSPDREIDVLERIYVGTLRLEKWFAKKQGAIFVGAEVYKEMSLTAGCFFTF